MYFVKWEDYPEEENSWEFEQHVSGCDQLISFFINNTVNGRYPPKFSFEEFDKFKQYIADLVTNDDPSSDQIALMARLVKGKLKGLDLTNVKLVKEVKESLTGHLHRLREIRGKSSETKNSNRLLLVPVLKEIIKSLHIDKLYGSITGFFEFVDSRSKTLKNIKKVEEKFNQVIIKEGEGTPIQISNNIDSETPDLEGQYITDYIFDMKIVQKIRKVSPEEPLVNCECDDCYETRDECCSAINGFPLVYHKNGRLSSRQIERDLIFECNSKCKCPPDCANRQVQRGRQFKLEIFRTESKVKGWGVRALEKIPKGSFITHYPGEVVSLIEAGKRPTTYLFDLGAHLDSTDVEYTYVVDASKYGNVTRFVNHSCSPNCRTLFTWIDRTANNLLPIIALFAIKDIRPFEELTYDYSMEVIDYYDATQDERLETDSEVCSVKEDNERPDTPLSETSDVCQKEKLEQSSSAAVNRKVENRNQNIEFQKISCECGAINCKKYLYS